MMIVLLFRVSTLISEIENHAALSSWTDAKTDWAYFEIYDTFVAAANELYNLHRTVIVDGFAGDTSCFPTFATRKAS